MTATPGIDGLQAGLWVPPGAPFCAQGALGQVANRAYLLRFPCPRSMTITKMTFFVATAATADDPCDVGIYDSASPLNRLGSSGSISGLLNSTGLKQVSLAAGVPLVAGQVYYAAFVYGPVGGTVAQLQVNAGISGITTLFGSASPNIESFFNNASFPLPPTLTVLAAAINAPIMALLQ